MLLCTLRRLTASRGFRGARPATRYWLATLSLMLFTGTANAQYFGGYDPGCSSCSAAPVSYAAPAPVSYQSAANCQTICQPVCQQAMVVQPCYQTVPVTEMREEKQTVMRPVTETKYVDQTVTEMRPITETRTAEVPVTTYQPVTEYQTVCRDAGCWQTRYTPNCRVSPCQYDGRPGLLGWMNRTGYEMRSAFTPKYTAHREYHPRMVTQTVPVTRQVAQHGTQQVTYNVTRYEPHQTTRKVAVQETRMVAEEISVQRPVTTYRTVPVGTTMAYAPLGSGGALAYGGGTVTNVTYGTFTPGSSQTAQGFGPTPDPVSAQSTKIPSRTANAADGKAPAPYERNGGNPNAPFGPNAPAPKPGPPAGPPAGASLKSPKFRQLSAVDSERVLESRRIARGDIAPETEFAARETFKQNSDLLPATNSSTALAAVFAKPGLKLGTVAQLPSAVRSVRWTNRTTPAQLAKAEGPQLIMPTLAAAE